MINHTTSYEKTAHKSKNEVGFSNHTKKHIRNAVGRERSGKPPDYGGGRLKAAGFQRSTCQVFGT